MVSIIVAYDEQHGIAKDGKIPWSISEDMQHFKKLTLYNAVVMGRKTWDSLPSKFKPLPDRLNLVVTRNHYKEPLYYSPTNPYMAISLEHAMEQCDVLANGLEVFIIGGAQVYKEALAKNIVDRVIASEVKGVFDADLFFPDLVALGWQCSDKKAHDEFVVAEYRK